MMNKNGKPETGSRLSATQRLMVRGAAVLGGVAAISMTIGGTSPVTAGSGGTSPYTGTAVTSELQYLRQSLDAAQGDLELVRLERDRANAILDHSARYGVAADLASLIYDVALSEGVDPELAFRLVKLESGFKVRAVGKTGDIGLAQVRLPTARLFQPGITVEQLFEPERNLRIGLRYWRDMMRKYDDTELALLAYNRGPARVESLIQDGRDPQNGYASTIMKGYLRR